LGIKLSIPPATEPITLTEAKAHLRIDHTDDDTYITSLIKAARSSAEAYTQTSFFTQTWIKSIPFFMDIIALPRGEVKSITSVKFFDQDNAQQTVDNADYFLTSPSVVSQVQAIESGWPSSIFARLDSVQITYVTGNDDVADIPSDIKQAILMSLGHLYENRQDVIISRLFDRVLFTSVYLCSDKSAISMHLPMLLH